MIAKGNTHADGAKLADYLIHGKRGERAELWELRGFGLDTIADAFRTVHVMAEATRAEKPFFHLQLRNRDGEILTRPQWEYAAARIERMLGLADQPRAIAFHIDEKTGYEHMHVAWSRIAEDTLTVARLPHFKLRLKNISRELEKHFALEPVTNQRQGAIKYAPKRAEHEQARRLGQDVHELRNTIRECWDRSDCGRSFQSALEHEGFTLAQGDRRGFVIIDRAGGLHALGKRLLDVPVAKIRARLSDLSDDDLPSVATARAFVQEAREGPQPRQCQKPEPCWDRDCYDRAWQDAVINAAIKKETARDEQTGAGAGGRKKDGLLDPPPPEMIAILPPLHIEDVACAAILPATEACTEPVLPATEPAIGTGAAGTPGRALDAFGEGPAPRPTADKKNRSLGLYRNALSLTGILRRQFRRLASLLTGHASDHEWTTMRITPSGHFPNRNDPPPRISGPTPPPAA